MLLSNATYKKYICQKKEKSQFIAVGTVRMLIDTGHLTTPLGGARGSN